MRGEKTRKGTHNDAKHKLCSIEMNNFLIHMYS